MGYCGYRYRFGLYAAHSNITNSDENAHYHNFTISLYIDAVNCKDDHNFKVERAVQDWFKPLQGQRLEQTELFWEKETTVEGMGNTFFELLYDMIDKLGYRLVKLEIYENPIRVYAVSNKRIDNTVNEIGSVPLECLPIILLDDTISKQISSSDNRGTSASNNSEISSIDNYEILITGIDEKLVNGDKHTSEQKNIQLLNEEFKNNLLQEVAITIESNTTASDISHSNAKSNIKLNKPNKLVLTCKLLLGFICFFAVAIVTMDVIKKSGRYPQGSDTFCHLYRADLILQKY